MVMRVDIAFCVQWTWSSVLIVDDATYSSFTSTHVVHSILEKTFWGPGKSWKSPGIFSEQENRTAVKYVV